MVPVRAAVCVCVCVCACMFTCGRDGSSHTCQVAFLLLRFVSVLCAKSKQTYLGYSLLCSREWYPEAWTVFIFPYFLSEYCTSQFPCSSLSPSLSLHPSLPLSPIMSLYPFLCIFSLPFLSVSVSRYNVMVKPDVRVEHSR